MEKAGFITEEKIYNDVARGNFRAHKKKELMCFFDDVVEISNKRAKLILDARSEERFKSLVPEPRKGLRSGTIANSQNLPYEFLLEQGKMKSIKDLQDIFNKFGSEDNAYVFSCGSGITACVLALGASLSGRRNLSVYDGSWTEYGSLTKE